MTRIRTSIHSLALSAGLSALVGCNVDRRDVHLADYHVEDGPSASQPWESPSAADVRANYEPAEPLDRGWAKLETSAAYGAVTHGPLYFEDPFVDKSHGRELKGDGRNVYYLGWEDVVAPFYGLARFNLNWIGLPASAVVQPAWAVMESDGELSEQMLGYDHDAAEVGDAAPARSLVQP